MKKSTVIATCLVESGFRSDLEAGEVTVRNIFKIVFPDHNFYEWNTAISQEEAQKFIGVVSRASMIDVRKFIEQL